MPRHAANINFDQRILLPGSRNRHQAPCVRDKPCLFHLASANRPIGFKLSRVSHVAVGSCPGRGYWRGAASGNNKEGENCNRGSFIEAPDASAKAQNEVVERLSQCRAAARSRSLLSTKFRHCGPCDTLANKTKMTERKRWHGVVNREQNRLGNRSGGVRWLCSPMAPTIPPSMKDAVRVLNRCGAIIAGNRSASSFIATFA